MHNGCTYFIILNYITSDIPINYVPTIQIKNFLKNIKYTKLYATT